MKPEKLASGSWRVRVYLGEVNGKRTWKSITARTRQEALRKAAVYDPDEDVGIPLAEACRSYIEARGPELSPSTVRGYLGTLHTYIEPDPIGELSVSSIRTRHAQEWISRMPAGMSSKTKKNHLGFLTAVISYYTDGRRLRVRIARKDPQELHTPDAQEINRVLEAADQETRLAILLGIFGMRRGEICAITQQDLDRRKNLVQINKALAKDVTGAWLVKTPKTRSSVRWVQITPEVMAAIPKQDPIISCSPDCITNRFARAVQKAGVTPFRFHDLRSFFASIAVSSAIGASERTVMDIGGWKTPNVLKQHYERSISDQRQKDTEKILNYLSERVSV